jgi:hypothetical protein
MMKARVAVFDGSNGALAPAVREAIAEPIATFAEIRAHLTEFQSLDAATATLFAKDEFLNGREAIVITVSVTNVESLSLVSGALVALTTSVLPYLQIVGNAESIQPLLTFGTSTEQAAIQKMQVEGRFTVTEAFSAAHLVAFLGRSPHEPTHRQPRRVDSA